MSYGRRQKGEIRFQEVQGTRSHNKKPPFHGNWQPTVPTWEKRFCYTVGSVPWSKLLETKRSMYLYENVVQWNDSACEEAFHNAKSRFWAKMKGLLCDISLPDPDEYIDEVDWNSEIDPELYLDLEREFKYPDEKDNKEEGVILDNNLLNQSFSCTGWGEAEEDLQKAAAGGLDPRYRDFDDKGINVNPQKSNVSQSNGAITDNELGNTWKDSDGWKNNYNGWEDNCNEWSHMNERSGGEEWGMWDGNTGKREGAGFYMSRYKTSRFNGDDHQIDRGWWRNGRGRKRMNFVY
ncbi:hypothetical protein M5689_014772 [Euphorbia peplus]|nr:hypothetical protein M5689_014772 [Euphorbia peplus]